MAYPGPKVHRTSRRKLGRGQYPTIAPMTVAFSNPSADVIQLTFSQSIVVTGTIPLTSSTGAFVSQVITAPNVVTQTWTTSQAAATVSIATNAANVKSSTGAGVAANTITF